MFDLFATELELEGTKMNLRNEETTNIKIFWTVEA